MGIRFVKVKVYAKFNLFLCWMLTNAVLSIRSELKASIADTLKASLRVDTAAIATHHSIHNTLVNI